MSVPMPPTYEGPPKVLFCPFCGSGTLLLGKDKFWWTCLKCKREFGDVALRTPSQELVI
jgi:ribosomal protein L37AE/L43A